jgi:histidinol-phosphate aminotransferase
MSGYTPGEQPAPGQRVIKLNTNENPFPPSPKVLTALRTFDPERLRRYPNPMAQDFREAAARLCGVTPDMILAGNGSDDILSIVLRTFLGPGDTLAMPSPTYSLYPVLAALADVQVTEVPWASGWALPIKALLQARARAIFFANPNAPSGSLVQVDAVQSLARRFKGVVLVDEAYVEFADANCLSLVRTCPNVIITRTLSKSYALAGLRLGYAVARPAVIANMVKVKDSYNCDAVSIAAGIAALQDQAHAKRSWNHVRSERIRVSEGLRQRGFDVVPSQANFVLVTVPGKTRKRALETYRALRAKGILVRWFDQPGLADKLRISIGTRKDNNTLLTALG